MIANQTSRGLRSAARWIGLLGSSIALLAACGGTIEQTDVDAQHLENGNVGTMQAKAPTASSSPASSSTPKAPAASNATASAGNTATAPAKTPDPEPAADDEGPPADEEEPPATTETVSADLSFATDIWPIFNTGCAPCHTAGNLGGQSIGNADKTKALADAKKFEDGIISTISSGAMPQGCGKPPGGGGNCLTVDQFDDIKAWFDAGSPP